MENADFGYFGYCEILGFWIKSWFLDKSVLFWGGFPGSMSGKPGSGWVRTQYWVPGSGSSWLGYAVQGLGQEEASGLGWSRVGVVGRDRELGGQLVKGV